MTAWNMLGMNAQVAAHRRVELQLARQEQHDAANLVRGVLLGGIGERAIGDLERFGVDPAREHYAVRVRPGESFDLGQVERWLGTRRQSAARPNGLVALIDGDVAGFVASRPVGSGASRCARGWPGRCRWRPSRTRSGWPAGRWRPPPRPGAAG